MLHAFVILDEPIGLGGDPTAFQPVRIDAEIDGKKFQEMHVDGGAIAWLLLYPPSVDNSTSGVHVLIDHGRRI